MVEQSQELGQQCDRHILVGNIVVLVVLGSGIFAYVCVCVCAHVCFVYPSGLLFSLFFSQMIT